MRLQCGRRRILPALLGVLFFGGGVASATTWEVTVQNFNFSPSFLIIRLGDQVHWSNTTGTAHTVTADLGSFDSGAPAGNFSFSHTFTTGGEIYYHCAVHGGMTGLVLVLPAPGDSVTTLTSYAFSPVIGGITADLSNTAFRKMTHATSGTSLLAGLALPTGSALYGIEIEACGDTTPGSSVSASASVLSCANLSPACDSLLYGVYHAFDGTNDGCGVFVMEINPHVVIDNLAASYFVQVDLTDPTFAALLEFRAVRIFARSGVAPDPSGQTFADVPPGSQYHRYAELLARAGISVGCGDGNFCPNDPVTRGQLAVLLAKALGLWPN